jgi:hypothetical protein
MDTPRVVSFPATDAKGNAVRFTVGTDIIDYMESARTFGRDDMAAVDAHGRFQRRMIAIPDHEADVVTPMVLTISNENGLYLVRKDQGPNVSGWKLIELSKAFTSLTGGTSQVRALGANWTDDDRITIAIAIDDGTANAPSRILVAYDLSSRTTDWEQVAWVDCGTRPHTQVEGIRVLDEGNGTWTVILAGDSGPNDTIYLLKSNRAQSFAQALVFNPAVTVQEILDFEAVVHADVGGGLAILGTSGPTVVLAFRPFPTYNAQGRITSVPPVVPLPCPQDARVLEAGATRNGGTDLYIGGQGVHVITADELVNAEDAHLVAVTGADAAANVQDVVIADAPDGSVAVWALLQNGNLEFVKRPAVGAWSTPLRLRGDVQEVAPVHGNAHMITSLLVVYTDGHAAMLWQDAKLGLWQEEPLLVANPSQVVKLTCYGTSLRLLGAGDMPQPGVTVKVAASTLASVLLNNKAVFIGPDISVEAQTDANGGISLFDKVRSLTPAIYRFDVDGIDKSIDVNPAGGIHERFQTITADELRHATVQTPNGTTPLLPDNFRNGSERNQVDAVAGSLNHVAQLAVSTNGAAPGVQQVNTSAAYSSTLQAHAVPDGYRWGLQADVHGVRVADSSIVDQLVGAAESVGDFFVNLGDSIADFFEGVGHRIEEGWTFVLHKAEQAFEFVCALGDKVKRFVLETLEQVGSFFTWLWDQIKTGLEKLWEWLKFIFSWQDILRVRNAMVDAIDEGLHDMAASVTSLKTSVSTGFDYLRDEIRGWRSDAGDMRQLQPSSAGNGLLDAAKTIMEPIQWLMDKVTGNSVVAWLMNKLNNLFDYIIDIELPDPDSNALAAAEEFFEHLVVSQLNNVMNIFNRLMSDLARIFEGKMPGANDLSFDTVKNVLILLAEDVLEGVITALGDFVLGGLDLVQAMLGTMRNTLFARVRFPFIEELVKLVTLGFVSVDTSFRLIDGLMLMVAIPATIAYKLIAGEAPLKEGAIIPLPFGSSITVQSGSDDWRRFTQVAGVLAAWVKVGVAAKGWYKADKAAISGILVDSDSRLQRLAAVAFGTAGVVAERLGRHTNKGTPITELEDTMFAISVFLNAKTYAYLLVADAADFLEQMVARAGQPGFNPLMQANAHLDNFGYVVHFILRTAVYGIITDTARHPGQAETDEITLETLAWIDALGDQIGSAGISVAPLEIDPVEKASVVLVSLWLKSIAGVMHSARAGVAINDGVTLYN